MFEVTFLGTAASVPSVDRGLPAVLVEYGRHRFLVDCGEGTQRQLIRSGIGFRRLDKVLLTHGHLDHVLGLSGFASTVNLWDTAERLTIFAGPAPLRLARTLLRGVAWPDAPPHLDLAFVEVGPGPVFKDGALLVSAFPVRHRAADSFGYLFEHRPARPMLPARLDELGVPRGPERGLLARGEAVDLADGRRVHPDEVLGPPQPGVRVAVVGDAESVDDLVGAVAGVDLLVIEGTFLDVDADKARARSHLTVGDATRLAHEAGVGALWLTHLSSRYRHDDIAAAARAAWPAARAARDFDHVSVPSEAGVELSPELSGLGV